MGFTETYFVSGHIGRRLIADIAALEPVFRHSLLDWARMGNPRSTGKMLELVWLC
jgi:hypothetical protein